MGPEGWRRIEELYEAARKCAPGEREALLAGSEPEIRERVERMLAVESGDQLLDTMPTWDPEEDTATRVQGAERLGPYQIEEQIGAGGMGTVYRAIDTRLGRTVAIKIASARYSERFLREARAIATLNHPHVCTLHDIGPNYLVMEFLEGSTLAAEIKKGPLAPEQVCRYGAEIAGALAEAHALGIVHRDLKPSNVMLTRHGLKVLDFGLAKMISATGITETHAVVGTPAYMAPEQLEGQEQAAATDLFALGLVLYEMSVGRLPFPGASFGRMLSSGAPPSVPAPSRERAGVPPELDGLVSRLLEKDPAKRPQSAGEVSRELSMLAGRIAAPPGRLRWRPGYAVAAASVLLLGLAAWLSVRSKGTDAEPPAAGGPASYVQLTSFTDSAVNPVLSPDGRMLAFYRSANPFQTPDQIWLKMLPDGEPVQVTHDPRQKYGIAFSPDGSRIAYSVFPDPPALFRTYTASALGGDSELLLPNASGLTWVDDGRLLFSRIPAGGIHMGIFTSNLDGSGLREIYEPEMQRGMAHYSYPSPDKKWLLLVEMVSAWQPCRVIPFSGGSRGRQVGPADAPCVAAAWSPDGKWVYLNGLVAGQYHLWRQRFPDGKPEQVTSGSTEEEGIAMAPDGRSLITSIMTRQNSLWIHDSMGERPLSSEGYVDPVLPKFSRDGKHVYFLLRRQSPESPAELWRADIASGKSEVVIPGVSMGSFDISNDEREAVYSREPAGTPSEVWIASLDRSSPPRRIAAEGATSPFFAAGDEVLYRFTESHTFYLGAMKRDGTGKHKAYAGRIIEINGISPDRRVANIAADLGGGPSGSNAAEVALSLEDGSTRRICDGPYGFTWSRDGRYLYVEIAGATRTGTAGKTAAIPVPPGQVLPPLPEKAVHDPAEWLNAPGVKTLEHSSVAPGPSPSTYVYIKSSTHANLFRIPLR